MSDAHSDRDHAKLAPSAAHRWSKCPGSVAAEAALPDKSGQAAKEGTAAHELAAWCLYQPERWAGDMRGRVIDVTGRMFATRFLKEGAPLDENRFKVDEEMIEAVNSYVDIVRKTAGGTILFIEQKVAMSRVHPECFGTSDAYFYRLRDRTLVVFDLKYGRGVPVEAERNPQIWLYAQGALERMDNHAVDHVEMHIVQPRCPHEAGPHRVYTVARAVFDQGVAEMAAAAKRTEDPNAPRKSGEWCRFCKASAVCPARRQDAMDTAMDAFGQLRDPAAMGPDELADTLGKARQIQHWVKSVEEYAHAEAMAGRMPTGFKLVAGRATRSWKDEETVKLALPAFVDGLDYNDIYEPEKLRSPAQMEKLLSKEARAALAPFIQIKTGSTQLVPEDDRRPAVRPSAEDAFAGVADDANVEN